MCAFLPAGDGSRLVLYLEQRGNLIKRNTVIVKTVKMLEKSTGGGIKEEGLDQRPLIKNKKD